MRVLKGLGITSILTAMMQKIDRMGEKVDRIEDRLGKLEMSCSKLFMLQLAV